jgi:3-methyladenine DNA glycosylase/8-oxoguanine DNA glycosylase
VLPFPKERLGIDARFSLNETFAPVSWSAGKWPNEDWIDGAFWWVGREADELVWRRVGSSGGATTVSVTGSPHRADDAAWFARVCKPFSSRSALWQDPSIERLGERFQGAWSFCYGTLFDGLVASIVGQSISLAAAGVTAGRLATLFSPGLDLAGRLFVPLPTPAQLAEAESTFVRQSGVTTKRAEALCAAGRLFVDRHVPEVPDPATLADLKPALLALPGIGPWTVASAFLWGIAHPDAFPRGDVALLRAVRRNFRDDTLDMKSMERLSEAWRPFRGEAARLLWLDLLGPATEGRG